MPPMQTPANPGRTAFICAMPMEVQPLVRTLSLTKTKAGDVTMYAGTFEGREVVATVTGRLAMSWHAPAIDMP